MSAPIRGIKAALNSTGRYKYKVPELSVDHLVIGGGVVGLATARHLCQHFPEKTTYLVERHSRPGEETSSRNSEVIHSGIYYPPQSSKTRFCLSGRKMLYDYCKTSGINHCKTGKLIVAHANQVPYIQELYKKSLKLPDLYPHCSPSIQMISGDEARSMEPHLSESIVAALWSPETGIIDSHSLMESFEKDVIDDGGELVYSTEVVRIDPSPESAGWVVQTLTEGGQGPDAVHAKVVVNAAGLSAPYVVNSILPEGEQIPMYYARGSYASYTGPGVAGIERLIYPCPEIVGDAIHAFQGLGTHLTLDLQGKVRFGPDVEWLSPQESMEDVDFWRRHLVPNDSRLGEMHAAVTKYLPRVSLDGMATDYVGIRPKIEPPWGPFQDFLIKRNGKDKSFLSLLAIESPGLTSCMALAKHIVEDVMPGISKE